jgi:hypothetical protein
MNEKRNGPARPNGTARQVHDDIEQTLAIRSATGDASKRLEGAAKDAGRAAWRVMKRHPFLAVLAVGVGGIVVATEIGVAELALGGALALAAYKVLREGEPPIQAFEEIGRRVTGV